MWLDGPWEQADCFQSVCNLKNAHSLKRHCAFRNNEIQQFGEDS